MGASRWSLRVVSVIATAMLACLFLSGASLAQDDAKGKSKGKGKGKGKGPEIVELDLGKLPPDLAKAIRDRLQSQGHEEKKAKDKKGKKDMTEQYGQKGYQGQKGHQDEYKGKDKKGKGKGKTISLADAIRAAEAQGAGEAVKAERKTKDGVTQFKVELLARDGSKSKIALDARGRVLDSGKEPADKDKKKGKKKGKED